MPGFFPNVYCYVPWQSQFVLDGCLAFMKINARTLSQPLLVHSLDSHSLFSMDAGIYENKHQDSFPNVYCYVPWQSQFVLDGWLAFIFINARTLFPTSTAMFLDIRSLFSMDACHLFSEMQGHFSKHLLLCPLTVAVYSRWMLFVYENEHQDTFPNVYCYVIWQSHFSLDGCLAFMKINARALLPTSTAISPDSRSLFSMDAFHLFSETPDSFPNIYCYVPWQSQFVLNGCLSFMKMNTRTLFPTSTAMSLDRRSLFLIDACRLFS